MANDYASKLAANKRREPDPASLPNPETTGCRYPMWRDEAPTQRFCGAARSAGSSYCAEHRKRCYAGLADRAKVEPVKWNYGAKPAEKAPL